MITPIFWIIFSRFVIRHSITRSAMKQTVISPGSSGRNIGAFQQQSLNSPERTVSRYSGPGSSAADDNDIIGIVHKDDGLVYCKYKVYFIKTK